jgi:hypothetical protein
MGRVTVAIGEEVIRSGLHREILPDGVKLVKVIFRELENEHWMILEGSRLTGWQQGCQPYHYPSYQYFIEDLADTIVGRMEREGERSEPIRPNCATVNTTSPRPGDELLR